MRQILLYIYIANCGTCFNSALRIDSLVGYRIGPPTGYIKKTNAEDLG